METPPAPPSPSSSPFTNRFAFTLLAPVASMAIAAASSLFGKQAESFSMGLAMLTLAAMLVCAVTCATWVGKVRGVGMGFVAFFAISLFYIAVSFAGCATLLSQMNLH